METEYPKNIRGLERGDIVWVSIVKSIKDKP